MAKSSTSRQIAHFIAPVLLVLLIISASRTSCQAEKLNSSDQDHYSSQLLPVMIRSPTVSCFQGMSHCTFSSCSDLCKEKGLKTDKAFCFNWTDEQHHSHVECCCPHSSLATKILMSPLPFTCYHDLTGCTTCIASFCRAKGFVAEKINCFNWQDDSGRAHSECCCTHETV